MVNESIENVLGNLMAKTILPYGELPKKIFFATQPGCIVKNSTQLKTKWKMAGVTPDDIKDFLNEGLKEFDGQALVQQNPYYQVVKPNAGKYKDWSLDYIDYKKGEVDIVEQEFLSETTLNIQFPIAIHQKPFQTLALSQGNKTWMSITPNEIITMESHIEAARGKVLTAGLGLGYYTYMCALKDEVESVTVIERNREVIEMFKTLILPQFDSVIQEKIIIIESDYYEFIKEHNIKQLYDYSFVDIHLGGSEAGNVYLLSEDILCSYDGEGEVHYWLEEGIHLKWQMGLILALYNKFVGGVTMHRSFEEAIRLSHGDKITSQIFMKAAGWVYQKVYTLGNAEEVCEIVFNEDRYKMLATYTDHLK